LKRALVRALKSYLRVLDEWSVANIVVANHITFINVLEEAVQ
jgi:hypothetical protein